MSVRKHPIRVLWINHRDPHHPQAGGAESYLWEIVSRMDLSRIRSTWLCETVAGRPSVEEESGVCIVRKGTAVTLHLYAPLLARKFDVAIESVAHAVPFFSRAFHRIPRITLIYHVHQDVARSQVGGISGEIIRVLERSLAWRGGPFVAISTSSRDEAVSRLGVQAPIEIVRPGVDFHALTPGTPVQPPNFVCVGRLRRYKRVDHIIRGFELLGPGPTLTIVGDGDDRTRLEGIAKDNPRVRFLGRVDEATKNRVLQQATANVVASSVEGFALTVVEAAACGTPTVCYDNSVFREVVQPGRTGIIVPDGDVRALAEGMKESLQHPEMRAAAREFALTFDWNRSAAAFQDIILRAVEQGPS